MTVEQALQSLRKKPQNAEAWEVIAVDAYQPLLAYVASLLLTFRIKPGESAHDIVHNVLLTFYQRWPRSKTEIANAEGLHAYLRASCRNLLVDRYRKERNIEQLDKFLNERFPQVFETSDESFRSIFLQDIINKTPSDCTKLFRLYVVEELTPAEIADRLNISPSAFYSRWHRCIQKAQEIILQKKLPKKRL